MANRVPQFKMPPTFEEILTSRLFIFTVGSNVDDAPSTFSLHEEAIAKLSAPLRALTRSGLTESQAGATTWDDVSRDTFVRFAQFAYTGDYSIPVMKTRERAVDDEDAVAETTTEIVAEAEDGDDFGWGSFPSKKKKKFPGRKDIFRGLSFELLALRNSYDGTLEPADVFDADKIYTNVFIAHAALWILGDYRLIDSLKSLALYKLHKTLCVFKLDHQNVGDVIELVRYAYSEEGGGGSGEEGDIGELRTLVCQFVAAYATVLGEDEKFMGFLGEGGQFVKDYFRHSSEWTV